MQKNRRRKNEEEFFEQVNHMNLNEEMSASWEEREVTEKLSSSVEDIKVPKSLEVESVKSQLKAGKKRNVRKYAEVAATIALVIAVGGTGVYQMAQRAGNPDKTLLPLVSESLDKQEKEQKTEQTSPVTATPTKVKKQSVVGEYRLAKSYKEVSECFSKPVQNKNDVVYNESFKGMEDEGVSSDDLTNGGDVGAVLADGMQAEVSESKAELDSARGEASDYSTTNLLVEGVDEADYIKNDGNFLYIQVGRQIKVIDIRNDKMEEVASVDPNLTDKDIIHEIFLDAQQLYIILSTREEQKQPVNEGRDVSSSIANAPKYDIMYYPINYKFQTKLMVYDITDKNQLKLVGTTVQDGSYREARKVGEYLYLFSQTYHYNVGFDVEMENAENLKEAVQNEWEKDIPCINGQKVPVDSIYVKDDATGELVISSIHVNEPNQVVDKMVLVTDYAELYMGTDSIYLYRAEWSDWQDMEMESYTKITKFSYQNGRMNGVGEGKIRGTIPDKFAISESNGILRVLTTDWAGRETHNQLYLLDKELKELGSLKDFAKGEEIYAARYIGNIAYFITYHNTDPLFAVDIADPTNPIILGQVEISGFSDYLHPFVENLLLGLGYETDPETSERLGIKLVMFDISDPVKPSIKDFVVLDGTYTNAADNYKGILVNVKKNLIGFDTNNWRLSSKDCANYELYQWSEDGFVQIKEMDMEYCINQYYTRGLYAGNRFYLVYQNQESYVIKSFAMNEDYREIDQYQIKWENESYYGYAEVYVD